MIDHDKNKRIIEAATDGPWSQHITYVQDSTGELSVADTFDGLNDASYIAHFNPKYLREYEARMVELEKVLHEIVYMYDGMPDGAELEPLMTRAEDLLAQEVLSNGK
ncbi:MAG: hypothetical protein KAR42_15655 [candidate division Zixibacteria bacterium]|nr:hypothetical protein [candidate division Zixibacteria bacterium]